MIEPGSRYLCIVRGGSTNVFLPFEGDAMLSLILSKAFMLAADSKIKDASILRADRVMCSWLGNAVRLGVAYDHRQTPRLIPPAIHIRNCVW